MTLDIRPRINLPVATIFIFSLLYLGTLLRFFFNPSIGPDGEDFLRLADTLRNHGRFALEESGPPMFDRVPLYPILIAASSQLPFEGEVHEKVVIVQLVAVIITTFCVAGITGIVVGPRWLLPAGLIFVVYRSTIYTMTFITREPLAAMFLYAGLYLYFLCSRSEQNQPAFSFAAGTLLAAGAMTREDVAGYLPLIIIALAVGPRATPYRQRMIRIAAFALGLFVIFTPWCLRNWQLSGRLLLLSTAGGTEFYAGNNPSVKTQGIDYSLAPMLRKASQVDPFETDRQYRDAALKFIVDHPREFFSNFITKVRIYLAPNQFDIGAYGYLISVALMVYALCVHERRRHSQATAIVVVIGIIAVIVLLSLWRPQVFLKCTGNYLVLLVLGTIGATLGVFQHFRKHWPLMAIYLFGIMIAGVIIPQYRQRFVLDGILCIYTCFTIDYVCQLIERKLANARPASS